MSDLFDAVDALIASASPLPPPAERERLRKAHGLTQEQVANALKVRRATVVSWESGKTEPRPPQREAYARLLAQLAELYPANTPEPAPATASEPPATASVPRVPSAPETTFEPEPAPAPASSSAPTTPVRSAPPATPRRTTSRCKEDPAHFLSRGC